MLRQSRHPTTEEKFRGSNRVASSKKLDTLESENDSKEIPQLIPRRKLRINSAEDGGLLNAPHTFLRPNQEIPRQAKEPLVDFGTSIRKELEDCSMSDSFQSIEKEKKKQSKPLNFPNPTNLTIIPQAIGLRRRKSSLAIMETRELKDSHSPIDSNVKQDNENSPLLNHSI